MARELVQCTLPHSDPGQVPFWKRTNGNLTLSIVSDYDPQTGELVGYPYGSIPRLVLFWLTTEALRTGSRRLELGKTYGSFLRDLGLDPNTGGGKRGDALRVRNQTRRLFTSRISFIQSYQGEHHGEDLSAEARVQMSIASKSLLWWDPKRPNQTNLWGSNAVSWREGDGSVSYYCPCGVQSLWDFDPPVPILLPQFPSLW